MKYILNVTDNKYKESNDIELLNNICEYYKMLLMYLEVMKKTTNSKLFYRLLNDCYTLNTDNNTFISECENLLGKKSEELITNIVKYDINDKNMIKNTYFETWNIIALDDFDSNNLNNKELENLVNNNKMLVLNRNNKKHINNSINIINNGTYYLGVKYNNNLKIGELFPKLKIDKNSYYYIENYEPLVNAIRNKYFPDERIDNDINTVSSLYTEYLLIIKNILEKNNKEKSLEI